MAKRYTARKFGTLSVVLLGALHLGLSTPPLYAQEPSASAPSAVHVKGGRIVRGTLVEMVPGVHLTVRLADGRVVTLPWSDVERIERSSGAEPPPPPPPSAPPATSSAIPQPPPATTSATPPQQPEPPPPAVRPAPKPIAPRDKPTVRVRIRGDETITLQRLVDGIWTSVCDAPCNADVDVIGGEFRTTAKGYGPSKPFTIDASPGQRVTLDVATPNSGLVGLGVVGIVGGSITFLAGVAVMGSRSGGDGSGAAAAVLLGLGTLVGGIVLVANNNKTTIDQQVGRGSASRLPPWRAARGAGDERDPRDASALERVMPRLLVGATFLSGSF